MRRPATPPPAHRPLHRPTHSLIIWENKWTKINYWYNLHCFSDDFDEILQSSETSIFYYIPFLFLLTVTWRCSKSCWFYWWRKYVPVTSKRNWEHIFCLIPRTTWRQWARQRIYAVRRIYYTSIPDKTHILHAIIIIFLCLIRADVHGRSWGKTKYSLLQFTYTTIGEYGDETKDEQTPAGNEQETSAPGEIKPSLNGEDGHSDGHSGRNAQRYQDRVTASLIIGAMEERNKIRKWWEYILRSVQDFVIGSLQTTLYRRLLPEQSYHLSDNMRCNVVEEIKKVLKLWENIPKIKCSTLSSDGSLWCLLGDR